MSCVIDVYQSPPANGKPMAPDTLNWTVGTMLTRGPGNVFLHASSSIPSMFPYQRYAAEFGLPSLWHVNYRFC